MRGDIKGELVPATARFLSAEETAAAKKSYAKKYGLMGWVFELLGNSRKICACIPGSQTTLRISIMQILPPGVTGNFCILP